MKECVFLLADSREFKLSSILWCIRSFSSSFGASEAVDVLHEGRSLLCNAPTHVGDDEISFVVRYQELTYHALVQPESNLFWEHPGLYPCRSTRLSGLRAARAESIRGCIRYTHPQENNLGARWSLFRFPTFNSACKRLIKKQFDVASLNNAKKQYKHPWGF